MTTDSERIEHLEHFVETQVERRKSGVMENHAQTIIVFVILGVLSWVGYSIMETSKEVTQTNTSIAVMKSDMQHMKNTLDQAASRYVTLVEYNISKNELNKDLAELKARVTHIEQELQKKP
jgi:predicted negative regulator of RcsB-dependent stress response